MQVVSGDLTSPATWATLPTGWDQIYLLAAVVGVRNVEQDPARVIRVNTLAALHLLDWLGPGERVFFASTSEVYAGGVTAGVVPVPTPEAVPTMIVRRRGPPLRVRDQQTARRGRVPAHRAGPGLPDRGRPVPQRVRPPDGRRPRHPGDVPARPAGGDPFPVPGADQYRAFCHVDDAVEAMLRLMAAPAAAGQIVHIGNDREETNIGDLAKLVLRVAGVSPAIAPRSAPPGSVARRCPDLSRLRELTGYEPSVSLEEGVRSTFAWYREHGWA